MFLPFVLIYDQIFLPINLPWTVLLILIIFYWLAVIIGITDTEIVEFDLDFDVDANMSFPQSFLHFFNVGDIPFLIIASIGILCSWSLSVLSNYYLSDGSLLGGLIYLIPNLIISGFVVKFSLKPFIKMFKALNEDSHSLQNVVGMVCKVHSSEVDSTYGQAELIHDGASLLVNVKTEGDLVIKKGQEALILSKQDEGNYYLVKEFESF